MSDRPDRRFQIINCLRMMGYIVNEDISGGDEGVVAVALRVNSGELFISQLYPMDFERPFVVETVAEQINNMIKARF